MKTTIQKDTAPSKDKKSKKNVTVNTKTQGKPAQNKKHLLLRLWQYIKPYKVLLIFAFILTISSNVLALFGPLLSGYAIDAIEPGAGRVHFNLVFKYVLLMIVFFIVSNLLGYILSILMIRMGRNIVYSMRSDIFDKLSVMPVSFFDRYQAGEVISIISYDIDTINSSISTDIIQIATSTVTVIGALVMMLTICPKLVLIFAVTVPLFACFARKRIKKVRPLYRKRSERLGKLNGFAEEAVTGQKTVKAYNREEYMLTRFECRNHDAVEAGYNAEYMGSITGPTANFFNNSSLALVCMFGGLLYMFGSITLGNISAFVLYSKKFAGPINEFANILTDLQSAFAAANRVFSLIDETPEKDDAEDAVTLESTHGNVALEDVSFCYDDTEEILSGVSLEAPSGSITAIVGPTGAGKTTVINLLMRFYDPNSGKITLDGTDIRDITRDSLRSQFSMVLQDTWLFYGTVYENIAYGCENATREDVENAAKAAEIHNYIMSFPDGYDTVISDNGINVSKGQKQLLTIARAMLSPSKMLILDEATSNVDTATERKILKAMNRLTNGKTCFVIAHRLSTVENADNILVIDDGKIAEEGTHEQLLKKQGLYHKLYHSQFEI